MIRRPPRSTLSSSSAASDVYKRQGAPCRCAGGQGAPVRGERHRVHRVGVAGQRRAELAGSSLSLIHISEPTRLLSISYAVFCLKKKKKKNRKTKEQKNKKKKKKKKKNKKKKY